MTVEPARAPTRVLFLCSGNSARSQMAEALLNARAQGRFVAESAGSQPAAAVNPFAVEALSRANIDWSGRQPRGIDAVNAHEWDLVITLCDRAKEHCPILPGRPVVAHWGMDDPAEVAGTDAQKLQAFIAASVLISRRIALMLALPTEGIDRLVLEHRLAAIAQETAPPRLVP
jgi:arsenate reductase